MVRTQIQFSEEQMEALRRLARQRNRPVAEIVRRSVDEYLAKTADFSLEEQWRRAGAAVGGFRSGRSDISQSHDRYLAEALKEDKTR